MRRLFTQLGDALKAKGLRVASDEQKGRADRRNVTSHVTRANGANTGARPAEVAPFAERHLSASTVVAPIPVQPSPGPSTVAKSITTNGPTLSHASQSPKIRIAELAKKARPASKPLSHVNSPPPLAKALTPKAPQPKLSPSADAVPSRASPRLIQTGAFRADPLLLPDPADDHPPSRQANSGVVRQLLPPTDKPVDGADLVIGLDFGTSSTKVVIRDRNVERVFPVKFREGVAGVGSYLLASRLYRTAGVYSLEHGEAKIDDLKLRLLECNVGSPVREFNDCCAFLALVIRQARGWLFTHYGAVYARHYLEWSVNLGLAARSYEDEATVTLFKRLAWAAANVADQPEMQVTEVLVERFRCASLGVAGLADRPVPDGLEFKWSDHVDVVPEVSAQIHGFMQTSNWDWMHRPIMMLVDVGAGTVDSAIFHVAKSEDEPTKLTFYSNRVEQNGVMNLHRKRVDWLQQHLPGGSEHAAARDFLDRSRLSTDRLRPLPERVHDYLPGYEIMGDADNTVDTTFWREGIRQQVGGCIKDARVGKGVPASQIAKLPLLLCGGGSRMHFYGKIAESISALAEWDMKVEKIDMPVPEGIVGHGFHANDFDRLSVAYGLSMGGKGADSLGNIVRATDVPAILPSHVSEDYTDNYIGKDAV